MKKAIFQLHLWCGIAIGAYAFVIGLSGAVLMFRQDLQAWAYPQVFARPVPGFALASPDVVVAELRTRFPEERFSGIDYPTDRRGTFLAYLTRGTDFRAVFLDPSTGRFLGELPKSGWIQRLQDLHFNLWAGPAGLTANGVGALFLLGMALTGLVIAWPGSPPGAALSRGLEPRVEARDLGAASRGRGAGRSSCSPMWAVTGFYFAFPAPVRRLVNAGPARRLARRRRQR